MTKPIRFGIVAGEKSGDILGAALITSLRKQYPDCEFSGVGGPAMEALGCESLTPMDRLSVMGFVEPLGRLPELFNLKKRLAQRFIEQRPAAFIGIDSPDFNLRLAATLHAQGIKTVHYVSPSVWAYRQKRIVGIKKCIDLMLTLFPFETEIYKKHAIPVTSVGHPLADVIDFEDRKSEHRALHGLQSSDQIITLMPGSRSGEIKRLMPTFIEVAVKALRDNPQLKFLIPYSGAESKSQIANLLEVANIFESEQFQMLEDSHQAISAADLVIMASGTATLEGLLLRRPMVICYKLAPLTFAIGSRLLKIPFVGLPNLLAGKKLVPEYLQNDVTVENLQQEIERYFKDPHSYDAALAEFQSIHGELRGGASDKAAQAIVKALNGL